MAQKYERRLGSPKRLSFASPFLERLAKYLPLEHAENFIIVMDNGLTESKWWINKRETIQSIFDFRRMIISSLEDSYEES